MKEVYKRKDKNSLMIVCQPSHQSHPGGLLLWGGNFIWVDSLTTTPTPPTLFYQLLS